MNLSDAHQAILWRRQWSAINVAVNVVDAVENGLVFVTNVVPREAAHSVSVMRFSDNLLAAIDGRCAAAVVAAKRDF